MFLLNSGINYYYMLIYKLIMDISEKLEENNNFLLCPVTSYKTRGEPELI